MPVYSGKFQYSGPDGAPLSQGPCQVAFDAETCTVTPASGAALAFDLGDVDRATPGEWDLRLTLYTGRHIELRQFGAAFGRMSGELMAAWRDRTVRCLLLEDLEEIAHYTGTAAGSAAEIRLYGSNLAVLPLEAAPLQWRLADIYSATFDDATYQLRLLSPAGELTIGKLAMKTDEFRQNLDGALEALRTRSAQALHTTFPFLNPDQLQSLLVTMPEGRSVRLAALAAIHPKLPEAVTATAVGPRLRPYFDALLARSTAGALMTGFKFIRPDEEEAAESGTEETAVETAAEPEDEKQADEPPLFFWFFFPLTGGKMVAWEATTGTGRATYFFRIEGDTDAAVHRLTRGLALVNFRREPIYLPDESLELQQRFHRYAIGARKLPDLRSLRSAYAGRAIHSKLDTWLPQVEAVQVK